MKKLNLKIALFFTIVAVIDLICGFCFTALRSRACGGQTHKNEYLYRKCKDDILILGSSKADHHYVPSVFEDSLRLSCYNAGEMGCGIIPAYVRYKMEMERHKPVLLLYEVTPEYDYLIDDGYSRYLGVIRPYALDRVVKQVYLDFSDRLERLRIISGMYRNNSCIVQNLKDIFKKADNYNGYEPLYGRLAPEGIVIGQENGVAAVSVDSLKLKYLEKLIEDTILDSVRLVFIISPTYLNCGDSGLYDPAIDLCLKYGVPIIDNKSCALFINDPNYYQDCIHLNNDGAIAYSRYVASQLKEFLSSEKEKESSACIWN